jgi:hypothetical protein
MLYLSFRGVVLRNTVILDVGTHNAEELKVLSGYRPYIVSSLISWWLDLLYRILKYVLFHKPFPQYGSGSYKCSPLSLSFKAHFALLISSLSQKRKVRNVSVIAIDPQFSITYPGIRQTRNYMSIKYLPIALTTHINPNTSIVKFNVSRNTLSSSLFDNTCQVVSQTLCPSFKTSYLLEQLLALECISVNDNLILRINSEGSELSIISDIISSNLNLKLVIGSINDVFKKFGLDEYNQLTSLLRASNIPYVYFKGSDPSSWSDGIVALENFLATYSLA